MREHRGVLILVLGIVGIVVCQPIGIAAWVMGNSDLEEMERGTMDPEGKGMTQAGKICGIISVALMVLSVLAFGAMILFAGGISVIEGSR